MGASRCEEESSAEGRAGPPGWRVFVGVHDLNVDQPFSVACEVLTLAGCDEHRKDAVWSGH